MTKLGLLCSIGSGLGGRCCSISFSTRGFQTTSFSAAASSAKMSTEFYTFGPYKIDPKEVFFSTPLSYAMVNLRPVVPGHVLVCPRREVKRFVDLTVEETQDLWLTAQRIGGGIERFHKASSLTFTIQDGPKAGQTVAHAHVHILPRKDGDFENNDEIYDAIDAKEKELKGKLDLDKERKDRSMEEMCKEAEEYRSLFVLP
ncbi:bifunctional bis(5'-adenosyl)-triphosphatase/adenylylsulfatase FHIT-like isoform X1 [Hibiscus syriacus]|uniref:bifunctional bis(5'-adenosyl)-triphosphatase/adenylylsulfatase FHIT-like isoform X1 n=1 Tax=Hibiscus syriacus TaxID=106335 RepID=UPI001921320A|nr:bifunctional bis(5'-adenosyl)-triphosphatase/adenylylsulfatase FHIT-like isoform X1 [Hibiscus syriacus]XP_039057699.1 bifunctional bis(5'-adenosyl)-triphosphatase/adenylylsulfatase FHIT-like isoform X1 [Hibiscus syriacus]